MSQIWNEDLRSAEIDFSTSGDHTIIAAPSTTGNYLAIDFVSLIPTTADTVQFKSGSTDIGGPLPLDAKQALTWENAIQSTRGIITCAPNEAFVINTLANTQVGGLVRYREVGN